MSEDELARALEPFRQINTSTLADRTGTGLGLPLTKALVEANRATLVDQERPRRGHGRDGDASRRPRSVGVTL